MRPFALALTFALTLVAPLVATPYAAAQQLTVSAASTLGEAFERLALEFEAAHPGVRVVLNVAGSALLAQQILHGAPVDVFASADEAQLRVALSGQDSVAARGFASNSLVVITPSLGRVQSLADLATPGTRLVLASPEVPVGAYARVMLERLAAAQGAPSAAAILSNLVSEEPSARQAAAKVALGEADAAVVYATDAAALIAHGASIRTLFVPAELAPTVSHFIVPLEARATLASAFIDFVLSAAGQAILAAHGFQAP
jgi:molybdate transport system substrate-binding protein